MGETNYIDAMNFACRAHADQCYGEFPYARHLAHVALVLAQFGFTDDEWLAAAWLHDSIEDTLTSRVDLQALFGERVALLVEAVTDGGGRNRRARHEQSFARMAEYPDAIILKLADRIANVESSLAMQNDGLLGMYAREHSEFIARLYEASLSVEGCQTRIAAMWSHLNRLVSGEG